MPDFLPVAELAAKSVRDAFSAVGALVHTLIPARTTLAHLAEDSTFLPWTDAEKCPYCPINDGVDCAQSCAKALADYEAENEVDEPADTKPLSVCPCEALEDSCFWCEEHPVGEFAFGYNQYLPLSESPAASATDAVVGNPPPDVPPTSGGADLTWIDIVTPAIQDVLSAHHPWEGAGGIECAPCAADWDTPFSVDHLLHLSDRQDWREHVSVLIAERLEDVTLALPETGQDTGGVWAAETFPQYQRPLQK